jgi:hypothetical protein
MIEKEDWVIDTNFLVIANTKKPNRRSISIQEFLDEFKEKRIFLVVSPKIYRDYEERCGVGKGDSWVLIWHRSILDRIILPRGKFPKKFFDDLTKRRFHYFDIKFVSACYLSDKKRLSTIDDDYSQSTHVKNYLCSQVGLLILNINNSKALLAKIF